MSNFKGAIEQIHELKSGKTSAAQTTGEVLDCIASIDSAGYELRSVLALSQHSQSYSAQDLLSTPLAGLPILIKDNVEAIGLPASAGSEFLMDFPVTQDSPLTARLRKAGAQIIGATNLSEWANIRSTQSTSGWSALGGLTANPWQHGRSAGGSSSGSGAAIAAGIVSMAVGSETDGSIICPASLNGCVGIKPTVGSIPRDQMVPISASQDSPGPMTRTVADAALMLEIMMDSTGLVKASQSPAPLRIGVISTWITPNDATNSLFLDSVSKLSRAGIEIIEIAIEEPSDSVGEDEYNVLLHELFDDLGAYFQIRTRGKYSSLAELVDFNHSHQGTEMKYFNQDLFDQALALGGRGEAYQIRRNRNLAWANEVLAKALNGVDVAIGTSYSPAWLSTLGKGDDHSGASWITMAPSIAGTPIGALPMGLVDGLPVGLGVIAGRNEEAQLVRAMSAIERALGIGILEPTFIK